MQHAIYIEINTFCILLVLLILYKVLNAKNKQINYMLFARVLICQVLMILSDNIWMIIETYNNGIPDSIRYIINVASNFIYFAVIDIGAFYTFVYSEMFQQSRKVSTRKNRWLCSIPLLIYEIITVLSVKTGWLFYIDHNNVYHRGPLYFIQVVVGVGYLLAAAISAAIGYFDKTKYVDRVRNISLSMLVVFPIFGGILQALLEGIPILSAAITFALINLYIDLQDEMILTDPLTQMNNRNKMNRVLASSIKNWNGSKKLYLLMIDVDSFKQVNDHYGHVKGDEILKFIGDILKRVASSRNYFTARYGGDEFIMLCEVDQHDEIKKICNRINVALQDRKEDIPLTVSIGYAEYNEKLQSIPDFIAAADFKLYSEKKEKKN